MFGVAKRVEVSSYDKAVEGILNHIVACDMRPGDAFPPERELCDEIGVSRTTLRSALTHLASTHVVERRQGSGNYLCQSRPTVQLDDLSGFSRIVHTIGGKPSSRVLTCEAVPAGTEIASRLYLPEDGPVLHLERLRLIGGVPAMLETSYLPLARFPGIDTFDFEEASLSRVLDNEYGVEAVHVTLRVTVARATEREAGLMRVQPDDLFFFGVRYADGVGHQSHRALSHALQSQPFQDLVQDGHVGRSVRGSAFG